MGCIIKPEDIEPCFINPANDPLHVNDANPDNVHLGVCTSMNDFKEAQFVNSMKTKGGCEWRQLDNFIKNGRNLDKPFECNDSALSSYRDVETFVSPAARTMIDNIQSIHDGSNLLRDMDVEGKTDEEGIRHDIRKEIINEIDKVLSFSHYPLEFSVALKDKVRTSVCEIMNEITSNGHLRVNQEDSHEFIFPGDEDDKKKPAEKRKKNALDNHHSKKKK